MQRMFQCPSCRKLQTWEESRYFYLYHSSEQLQTFLIWGWEQKWTCHFSRPTKSCQPDPPYPVPFFSAVKPTEYCSEASQSHSTCPVMDSLSAEDAGGSAEVFSGCSTTRSGLNQQQETHRALRCFRKAKGSTKSQWWEEQSQGNHWKETSGGKLQQQ